MNMSAGTSSSDKASAGSASAGKALARRTKLLPTMLLPTLLLQTLFLPTLFAATYDLKEQTPAVTAALEGRKARYDQLNDDQAKGWIGENNQGLVSKLGGDAAVDQMVAAENRDRMVIYQAIVQQNGLPPEALAAVQQVFAETQRDRAQPGDPIQLPSGEWTRK